MCEKTQIPLSKITGVTEINAYKLSYTWKIRNFKVSQHKEGEFLESAKFGPEENDNIKWSLRLYPRGRNIENKDYVSLFLQFHPTEIIDNQNAQYELGIYDKMGNIQHKVGSFQSSFTVLSPRWGFMELIKTTDLLNDNFLPNDCLTIFCNIFSSSGNIINLPNSYDSRNIESPAHSKLHLGCEALFKSEKLFDITFNLSGKTLQAHKAILAAHSPVFLAMFENDMKEKTFGIVDINDVEFEVFQEMLKFIYCGKTESMSNLANDLLYLADKYNIGVLKTECEKHLIDKLSIQNVIDILIVADLHHALNLKEKALNFFVKHKNELVQSDAFKPIKKLHSEIWEQLVHALILH